ncbi:hypothetical protein C8R45DRAFT_1089292 [Mycena sanguinolenta]|nr:hypothetical protein C8R45DRAFT_1089292 [Mycena sanguinolenta]
MSTLVDDNDPVVQYSPPGSWFLRGGHPEFNATTHASATAGSTAALVFEGTSISIYGTLGPDPGLSSLTFSIDGMNIDSYQAPTVTAPIYNQLFWASPLFTQAQHKLVVTVEGQSSRRSPDAKLFLDYFIYTTASTMAGETLLIDDMDASITYSADGWESSSTSDSSLENTQHVSTSVGSWAATSFNGTGISLVGTSPQTEFIVSIVVDGSQSFISQSQIQKSNQLFITSGLPSGPHTIKLTALEGMGLGIDYFFVTGSALTAQSEPFPSPSPSSALAAPSPSHPSMTLQFAKKPPIPGIVGGTIGSLVILVLLWTLMVWKRRKHAHHEDIIHPGVSILPRWMGNNGDGLSITAPRPFQLWLQSQTAETLPPPYPSVSKNLPVSRQT